MTLIKGMVIGFLACCALALAGCSSTSLITDMAVKASDIDVSSSQGVVTLIGRVRSDTMKQDAERLARGINGVTDVHNELVVGRVAS